jgi:signal peptidase I
MIGRAGVALVLGAAAVATLRRLALVTVRGDSMAPTFRDGDRLLALRRPGRACGRDDVVVFAAPGRPSDLARLVKRVAAVAGDPAPAWLHAAAGERVPPGRIAVSGDAGRSRDSRHFGYVRTESVTGVVVARLPRRASGRSNP